MLVAAMRPLGWSTVSTCLSLLVLSAVCGTADSAPPDPTSARSTLRGATVAPVGAPESPRPLAVAPDKPSGVYRVGEIVRWTVTWSGEGTPPAVHYTLKSGGLKEVGQGDLVFAGNVATVESKFDAPGTMLVEVKEPSGGNVTRATAGAVAAPERIQPAAAPPKDFDAFWKAKLQELKKIAPNPQLEAADAGKPGVDYWKITLDNIRGTHIQGQIARPATGKKFPALLIVQWAGVYGLQKGWVSDRAAEGWLTLNIEPHDMPIDAPESFYKEQAAGPLRNYWNIGNDDRDTSYYLRMYLSCYQAIEYLKTRTDWDGKTIVVTGTSQGGQQALMIAGLHPENITAMMVLVPAACDVMAPQIGRASGFPNWYFNVVDGKDAQKVREASRYYDPANFARHIKCPVLIGLGLRDETSPPSSVFATANVIRSPKEILILTKSGHQDESGTQKPYGDRVYGGWLPALRQGKPAPVQISSEARK